MKKTILILAAISMAMVANAQFRVDSIGNAIVSGNVNNISSNYKLTVEAVKNGIYLLNDTQVLTDTYGLRVQNNLKQGTGTNSAIYATTIYQSNHSVDKTLNPRAYGVQAIASRGNKNFAVSGIILDNGPGAGIYGGVSGAEAGDNVTGCYAGYFDGNTKVDGNLTVTYNILTPNLLSSPRGTYQISEEETERDCLGKLSNMALHTFYTQPKEQNPKRTSFSDEEFGEMTWEESTDPVSQQSFTKLHYGLSADELEEAFPDLVYELQDGQKAINYTELIPILVQSINELSQEVRTLKGENAMMSRELNTTDIAEVEATDIITLSQNDPNPWGTQTAIRMNIPERVNDAAIFIYDMSGKQVAEHRIRGRGETELKLTADTLVPGMYIYTLIADGKVISTKRMILTK